MAKPSISEGDVFNLVTGGSVVVLEYVNCFEIKVRHLDEFGHISIVRSGNLQSGYIYNPYRKHAYGVGYTGEGEYKIKVNGKNSRAYDSWCRMMERAYSDNFKSKHLTYKEVTVCNEWHNFQNFAEWFYQQPNAGKKGFHLDKDLMVQGNKEYSPVACSFVPQQINALLTDRINYRGNLPLGVGGEKGSFFVQISIFGKLKKIGNFSTPKEASIVYKKTKEDYVKSVAKLYKDSIHPLVYENLMTWEVGE